MPADALRGVVLAVREGSTVVQATGGPASADTGRACTGDTRFAVASVSKQFTAAAVLLLVERGAVALDDPLSRPTYGFVDTLARTVLA